MLLIASGGLIQKWSWVIFRRAHYKMLMYVKSVFTEDNANSPPTPFEKDPILLLIAQKTLFLRFKCLLLPLLLILYNLTKLPAVVDYIWWILYFSQCVLLWFICYAFKIYFLTGFLPLDLILVRNKSGTWGFICIFIFGSLSFSRPHRSGTGVL